MRSRTLLRLTRIALVACGICLCSLIRIPAPVPFTLMLFGVFFATFALGAADGFFSTLLFLALGLVGLPVFSGGGGPAALLSPTGGYLLGTLLLSAFALLGGAKPPSLARQLTLSSLGLLLCYTVGTLWYLFYTQTTLWAALLVGVLPFLVPDAIKLVLALLLARRLKPVLR